MIKKIFRFVIIFCGMLLGFGISNYILNESGLISSTKLETESMVLLISLLV